MKNSTTPLLITTGEPAGIGMDITAQLLQDFYLSRPIIITACHKAWRERVMVLKSLGIAVCDDPIEIECEKINAKLPVGVYLLNIPCAEPVVAGKLNPNNAQMVKNQLDIAHNLAITNQIGAIITAPIAKSVMIDGGILLPNGDKFSGHTEYFMAKSGLNKVVMMLANEAMKVALVTTHIPLKAVPSAITKQAVRETIQITIKDLQRFGIDNPRILVCGLNPHAGENGHLGDEELTVINPVLAEFQADGIDISNALPADTLFTPKYLQHCDVVIAMYHDQGLAPLKSHGFGQTVNVTLGLPYVRTSVDHGTALDLAALGMADFGSLKQAVLLADKLATT